MALGQYEKAAEQWRRLLPLAADPWQKEAVELGLAMSWERLGTVNKVFLPETRIASPRIRAILLGNVAGPILLRMAVENPDSTPAERRLARFVLLFKEATRGQYANFLQDYNAEGLRKDEAEGRSLINTSTRRGRAKPGHVLLPDQEAGHEADGGRHEPKIYETDAHEARGRIQKFVVNTVKDQKTERKGEREIHREVQSIPEIVAESNAQVRFGIKRDEEQKQRLCSAH